MRTFSILLVDGGLDQRLENFIESEGHSILKAGSDEQALALTGRFQPDLIIMDRGSDGMSGLMLLPELMLEYPSAAVVMLVLATSLFVAVEAMKLGALDVLERPVDLRKLKLVLDGQKALWNK